MGVTEDMEKIFGMRNWAHTLIIDCGSNRTKIGIDLLWEYTYNSL
jgi:hypothetical protein